jgi:hypothetical protein
MNFTDRDAFAYILLFDAKPNPNGCVAAISAMCSRNILPE